MNIGLNRNMKLNNKRGYKQQENYLYEIEINEQVYSVEVDVIWFIKPSDKSSTDSDLDYEGYTEILDLNIVKIYTENENQGVGGYSLGYVGDWAVICTDCAKTHKTIIVPIDFNE